mgnify:FL=1|tara:strand:+ start:219 stop:455 length:237 start_codon:yes stop_codon:yes gene_type:complete
MTNRKLPKGFEGIEIFEDSEIVENPFSGESIEIPADAVAVYDTIMGLQLTKNPRWDLVRSGLDWFRKHEPKAYMVLLD